MTLTSKQIRQLMARARMQKARCHIGMNGVQPNTLAAFVRAFDGMCIRPEPCDVVRVKVHPTYTGSIDDAVWKLCAGSGAQFVRQDGAFLVFWKPQSQSGTDTHVTARGLPCDVF